jgi:hypothetical protein
MGSIRGRTAAGASVRVAPVDGSSESFGGKIDGAGAFEFPNVPAGWYILSASLPGGEIVKAIRVDANIDVGYFNVPAAPRSARGAPTILTVCEALENRDAIAYQSVVIVGIFKSGMDETLRLDCPTQLVTGEVGWPSAIGLAHPSQAPDELRDRVEKKRQEILKTGPPGAQPRPERVVGLYGIFVAPSGLTNARCCKASMETTFPPARLFDVAEYRDLRVIR